MKLKFQTALENAEEELKSCNAAIRGLKSATDSSDARRNWQHFLFHYVTCFEALDTAMKNSAIKSRNSNMKFIRKNDQILQYAFQWRNAAAHRHHEERPIADASVSIGGGAISFSGDFDIIGNATVTYPREGISYTIPSMTIDNGRITKASGPVDYENHAPYVILGLVENRGQKYDVPELPVPSDHAALYICTYVRNWLSSIITDLKSYCS